MFAHFSSIASLALLVAYFGIKWHYTQSRLTTSNRRLAALESQTAIHIREIAELRSHEACRVTREADRHEKQRAWRADNARIRAENNIRDPQNQLKFISKSVLRASRPVNKEASAILYAIRDWLKESNSSMWLSVEVAMGAFIKTDGEANDEAFHSYNSKRVDFLLIDASGYPALVIEYNGSGHGLSTDADARMAVKRLALQRAGIPLLEIPKGTPKKTVKQMISDVVQHIASMRTTVDREVLHTSNG